MVAIALDDPEATRWVESSRRTDGGVGIQAGGVFRDVTPVAVLAMRDPVATTEAVQWVLSSQARSESSTPALPHDPTLRGWAWTHDTFGWVEPTAWAVLALRRHGETGGPLEDGIALLVDRECIGGGWNYGNRIVLDEVLPPYVQTTGLALLALHGLNEPVVRRGSDWLESRWPDEDRGLLSMAVATAALRRFDSDRAEVAAASLRERLGSSEHSDTVALAWAAIALGDGLAGLEVG